MQEAAPPICWPSLPSRNSTAKTSGRWNSPKAVFARDEKGFAGGILAGDKLFWLSAAGAPTGEATSLPDNTLFAGLRPGQIIALCANPTRLEVLDRTGRQIRSIALEDAPLLGCALHPHKPICYVALDREVSEMRGVFCLIDEQSGTVHEGQDQFGQGLEVDPSGRFLVASYFKSIHVGDQFVVTQDNAGSNRPGRPGPPRPTPPHPGLQRPGPQRPGSQHPGAPQGGGGIHLGIRHAYADIVVALVYDLSDPLQPAPYSLMPLTNMGPGNLRISYDGRRLSSFQSATQRSKYFACDVLDLKSSPVVYELPGIADRQNLRSDLAFHPLLPLAIVVGGGAVAYLDSENGRTLAGRQPTIIPEWNLKKIDRAVVSVSGKELLLLGSDFSPNDHYLFRCSIPLTPQELSAMCRSGRRALEETRQPTAPLAKLTALGGGLAKDKKTAEIVADYSDAVVIVRTETSTGSGFIVGSSGLILTCAHCVSPLEKTEVVYHPQGQTDEKKTAVATIVRRDRKLDLALLRIEVPDKLHAVTLADPVDVKGGEEVTIIANPGLGREVLDNTVTTGIVSNGQRTIEGNTYIQSSAAVNPGSSGGAMFDRQGRVIGVVVLKAGIEGVGFAVPPVPIATFLLKAASRDGQDGQLNRKWIDAAGGREVEARLMAIDGDSVTLAKAGGKPQKRPRSTFSSGDWCRSSCSATLSPSRAEPSPPKPRGPQTKMPRSPLPEVLQSPPPKILGPQNRTQRSPSPLPLPRI